MNPSTITYDEARFAHPRTPTTVISTDFNPSGSSNAINATMLDLQAAMARAAPYPLTVGKEDWLAKRGSVPRSARRQSKLHGGGALAAPVLALAEIPPTVPELPNAYLVRESDIAALKAALLTQGGPSSAALTSANRKASDAMNSNSATTAASAACASKVGAHGMGGKLRERCLRAAVNRALRASAGA